MNIESLYEIFQSHPTITTDSRDCPKGSIFFALKGDNFDGNAYAEKAIEAGCSYAVIDEKEYCKNEHFILVDDVLTTLQQLANYHRRALRTPIIGITGTNGKTTTKELIAAVLSQKYNVLYTQGNFNNHIGVPKTLLRMTKEHDMAVIEMGANHPGEIKALVEIVEPDHGIITNVGKAHLEGFGSFEGVVRTKGELYDFLRKKSCAVADEEKKPKVFIHGENEYLMGIAKGLHLIIYGTQDNPDYSVVGEMGECAPFLNFTWKKNDGKNVINHVNSHLIGSYNIYNMLAAATIGLSFGIPEKMISQALASYVPSNNRSQLTVTQHNKLIVDAYNANPTSMNAALQNFCDMKVTPKMAILGEMRELGESSVEEHQKVVDFLKESDIKEVWLVGEEFSKTDTDFRIFKDVEAVRQEISKAVPQNLYILIKGSNGTKLFQLPELL